MRNSNIISQKALLKSIITLMFMHLLIFGAVAQKKNKELKELPKKGWTVTASSFRPQNPPARLVDNNTASIWHTPTGAGAPNYPHWFTVDMRDNIEVSHIVLYKRNKIGNGFGDFEVWGSTDGEDFVQYGGVYTLDHDLNFDNVPQYFEIKETPTVRFIKIVPLRVAKTWESQSANYTVLAEFGAVGTKK